MSSTEWEAVIGLEVHAHLKTRTKMFCRCELEYGAAENTRTCPVCLAHPGALPVPNGKAIEHTIKLGLALGCEISEHAIFARKNYFYPDLPKGYQISQYEAPLCGKGALQIPGGAAHRHHARASRGGRGEDGARGRRDRAQRRRRLLARRLQPRRHAAARDRQRARPPLGRRRGQVSCACCGRRSSSSGSATRRWRRERCAPTSTSRVRKRGRGGLPAALGAEEHELVHVHPPRHRGGRARADRGVRARRDARAVDVRLRPRHRPAHRAPLEGGGGRLPLLPGARPRAGRAAAPSCSTRVELPELPGGAHRAHRRAASTSTPPGSSCSPATTGRRSCARRARRRVEGGGERSR